MSAPGRESGPVRPAVAVVFATAGFVALAIFGLGMTSLVLDEDVIQTPGLGQVPGIAGMVLATLAFAGGLGAAVGRAGRSHGRGTDAAPSRGGAPGGPPSGGPPSGEAADRPPSEGGPSYGGAAWTTIACFLAYVFGVWIGAVATGADLAVAGGVAGRLATSWFGLVLAAAAFVCAWSGIALVRTRARRPRWPWEDEFDE